MLQAWPRNGRTAVAAGRRLEARDVPPRLPRRHPGRVVPARGVRRPGRVRPRGARARAGHPPAPARRAAGSDRDPARPGRVLRGLPGPRGRGGRARAHVRPVGGRRSGPRRGQTEARERCPANADRGAYATSSTTRTSRRIGTTRANTGTPTSPCSRATASTGSTWSSPTRPTTWPRPTPSGSTCPSSPRSRCRASPPSGAGATSTRCATSRRLAADHGVGFTLGIWQHDVQRDRGMRPTTSGLTPENIGPYSYAALQTGARDLRRGRGRPAADQRRVRHPARSAARVLPRPRLPGDQGQPAGP